MFSNRYFLQLDLLEKVPLSYFLQAGIFFGLQLIGVLLIVDARKYKRDQVSLKTDKIRVGLC